MITVSVIPSVAVILLVRFGICIRICHRWRHSSDCRRTQSRCHCDVVGNIVGSCRGTSGNLQGSTSVLFLLYEIRTPEKGVRTQLELSNE